MDGWREARRKEKCCQWDIFSQELSKLQCCTILDTHFGKSKLNGSKFLFILLNWKILDQLYINLLYLEYNCYRKDIIIISGYVCLKSIYSHLEQWTIHVCQALVGLLDWLCNSYAYLPQKLKLEWCQSSGIFERWGTLKCLQILKKWMSRLFVTSITPKI